MDEVHGPLPKLKDLGVDNKYADGTLLLRPELFYYNQGLTLKHQKVAVDKFEKARVLFTLSSKMVSEEYMSTLFNEEVIEKLKPQVVSMHGIDLPPELMHWRNSVGIIVKDSIRNSVSLTEQLAILRILSESENSVHPDELEPEKCLLEEEGIDTTEKRSSITKPAFTSLERLKRFARSRGSLSQKDLDHLNNLTIDPLLTSSTTTSRRPSLMTPISNTPTAPRASDAKKMDFSALIPSDTYLKHSSDCSSARHSSDTFQQRNPADSEKQGLLNIDALVSCPDPDIIDTTNCARSEKASPIEKVALGSSPEVFIKECNIDEAFAITDSAPVDNCLYNKVKEDCSWHSDMVTFAEPRSDMSFSDSDYEELLYEVLEEYRLETSNESSGDIKHLAKPQLYYSNDTPIDENSATYRSCLATFRKRFLTPSVLDKCAVESKSLRQSAVSLGPDAAIHEKATFDGNYEAVRSRFTNHMQIDVSIPTALANMLPISTSYSGSTTYKSFILDRHVDGVIVANAMDGSATLYMQPAHDHCIVHTRKAINKVYSQDAFVKKNYVIECKDLGFKQLSSDKSTFSDELIRYSKARYGTEDEGGSTFHVEGLSQLSTTSKGCHSGTAAKPNSRVEKRRSYATEDNIKANRQVTDDNTLVNLDTQHECCVHVPTGDYQLRELYDSTGKVAPKLTLSMLDSVSSERCQRELTTVQPSLPSLNNTTISFRGAVRGLAKTLQDRVPDKILSHSIVSSNIRATDTGKTIHRHSLLMKSSLPSESAAVQEDFTNETINTKICELNSTPLFKKSKTQISNICKEVPSGVVHMGANNLDASSSTADTYQGSLNFFEKNALLRYEKFASNKKERKILDSWQLTSVYGPNLIPFGGSNIKHSAVYVDIRDVVMAREQIKARFRTASDSSTNYGVTKETLAKDGTFSALNSTVYSKKNNTISVCAPRVSTRDRADWKLEKYSKRGVSVK
ncbi:Hypothetical protein GLP15_5168 [Giardia lamblia P15]|uniref:Uncharacterized protein n=1 Tax=Giardia intestinalis (strain P15) TaxID=658858 RepID=E1EWA0_GIAIA|nr:Hypothetical protein GLP15_5168 [Giardia lamblia P15]